MHSTSHALLPCHLCSCSAAWRPQSSPQHPQRSHQPSICLINPLPAHHVSLNPAHGFCSIPPHIIKGVPAPVQRWAAPLHHRRLHAHGIATVCGPKPPSAQRTSVCGRTQHVGAGRSQGMHCQVLCAHGIAAACGLEPSSTKCAPMHSRAVHCGGRVVERQRNVRGPCPSTLNPHSCPPITSLCPHSFPPSCPSAPICSL